MEETKFKNRREQADYYAKLRGWGPLTDEDRAAIDDAVRLVTNLDSRPKYAVSWITYELNTNINSTPTYDNL